MWQRWNSATKIFEKSSDNGAIWTPLGLDAAIIDQGVLADARISTSGTWTPRLQFGGAETGITYSVQLGTWVKIANIYISDFQITLTSKGSAAGVATIVGFPFTISGLPIGSILDIAGGGAGLTGLSFLSISGATLYPVVSTATGRAQIDNTNFTNATVLRGSLVVRV